MTVAHDLTRRASTQAINGMALEDRFEVLKEIGDGSFGSVVLARVRSAGASVARRGTIVGTASFLPQFDNLTACHSRLQSKQ
jgi:meiosis induction protein kinase IME2/SME1